ncbi:MAG TPA: hypothetical protein VIC84_12705 [Blastocatellia bacterium]
MRAISFITLVMSDALERMKTNNEETKNTKNDRKKNFALSVSSLLMVSRPALRFASSQ